MIPLKSCLALIASAAVAVNALPEFIGASSYISDWIPLNYTVEGGWPNSTLAAQQEIVAAAQQLATQGPWTVTNKTILPPDGDIHTYLSWSPYWWPDCSNVHNTTALTPQQIWVQCNYYQRDGVFNPDRSLVNDTGAFAVMSDAIFYNALAFKITSSSQYAENIAHWIDVWFLDNATYMNPNLIYSQVIRGANGSKTGVHEGILDLHCMTKVVSAIEVLKALGAEAWTGERDAAFSAWCTKYLQWLLTSPISLGEKAAPNNHGTFWFSQVASIQVAVGDLDGAKGTIEEYFNGIFMAQIDSDGEQPFEAKRTKPFHYRAYNSGGIITINRIAEYLGFNAWNNKSSAGGTIQAAIDFAMNTTNKENSDGPAELLPNVAAVASHFGDSTGKYAAYLLASEPLYPGEAWFFWNQPLSDSSVQLSIDAQGDIVSGTAGSAAASTASPSATGTSQTGGAGRTTATLGGLLAMAVGVTGALLL